MIDLNLLPSVARFQADKIKFNRLIKNVCIYLSAVWVVSLLIILAVFWFKKINLAKLNARLSILKQDWLSMSEGVVINQNLRQKSKIIAQILEQRFEYGQTFRSMEKLFGPEVKVNQIELKDKNVFTFEGEVNSNRLMDEVEARVNEINNNQVDEFSQAIIKSVGIASGVWKFGLEVKLR